MTYFFSSRSRKLLDSPDDSPDGLEKHMQQVEEHLRKVQAELEQHGRDLGAMNHIGVMNHYIDEPPVYPPHWPDYKHPFPSGMFSYTIKKEVTTQERHGAGRTTSVSAEVKAMRYYLLVYEPKGGGNSAALAKTLQKMDAWWNFVDRVWIIGSTEAASDLWNRITGLFGKNDNVLIIELPSGPDRQGWLPQKAWEWFDKSMPRGKRPKPPPASDESGSAHFAASDPPAPPPAAPAPSSSALGGQEMLTCDFCGCEAPAYTWTNGDCPRCGIRK